MAKLVKSAISGIDSFKRGWEDGITQKVGTQLRSAAESEAYARGVARAMEFRRRISAQKPSARREGKDARQANVPAHHNPYAGYKEHEQRAVEWAEGWNDADRVARRS
jgi:hypothetical protein